MISFLLGCTIYNFLWNHICITYINECGVLGANMYNILWYVIYSYKLSKAFCKHFFCSIYFVWYLQKRKTYYHHLGFTQSRVNIQIIPSSERCIRIVYRFTQRRSKEKQERGKFSSKRFSVKCHREVVAPNRVQYIVKMVVKIFFFIFACYVILLLIITFS